MLWALLVRCFRHAQAHSNMPYIAGDTFRVDIVGNIAKWWISKRVFQVNVCFSENLTCFVFLKHPFWDSPFCLITDQGIMQEKYGRIGSRQSQKRLTLGIWGSCKPPMGSRAMPWGTRGSKSSEQFFFFFSCTTL